MSETAINNNPKQTILIFMVPSTMQSFHYGLRLVIARPALPLPRVTLQLGDDMSSGEFNAA